MTLYASFALGIALALPVPSFRTQAQIAIPTLLSSQPKGYVCGTASHAIRIDGRLDDAAWARAPWTDDFVDIEGPARAKPRYRTRVKMLWDAQNLYIGAELEEPHVWGNLLQRDTVIFNNNDFEVFIDPDGDNLEYGEFEMNALNTGWDLFLPKPYKDGGTAMDEWTIAGIRTAVWVDGTLNDPRDTDRGWTLEIAIPWRALARDAHVPSPPRPGNTWRINFSRVEWRHDVRDGRYLRRPGTKEDNWVWSPQGVIDMHRPEMWGYVQFVRGDAAKTAFAFDQAHATRAALMRVYYAEYNHHLETGAYASKLSDLGLTADALDGFLPTIILTQEGYIATADQRLPGGKTRRWHVRQDSKLYAEFKE